MRTFLLTLALAAVFFAATALLSARLGETNACPQATPMITGSIC